MKAGNHSGPAPAGRGGLQAGERYSISLPDEQGNRFITVLGDDGSPLPPNEPSEFDREGA